MRDQTAKEILEEIKTTYKNIAKEFSKTRRRSWEEFKTFSKYIKANDTVADIGCGNGRFLEFISAQKNVKYTGIDNNKELLKTARAENKQAKFIEGDLLDIPLPNSSNDVTVCIATLHHIPSKSLREKAIKELARITKKDGHLILSNWNLLQQKKYKKNVVKALVKWLYTLGKYEKRGLFIPWGNERIPRYYYAFREKELETLLKPHFKIVEKKAGKNIFFICEKLCGKK